MGLGPELMKLVMSGVGSQGDVDALLGATAGSLPGSASMFVGGLSKSRAGARAQVKTSETAMGAEADAQYARLVEISGNVEKAVASLAAPDGIFMGVLAGLEAVIMKLEAALRDLH